MDWSTLLYALGMLTLLLGLAGIVLPALPGVPLMYLGLVLLAWADGFARVGTAALVTLGLLTVLAVLLDLLASVLGAKRVGASRLALLGAAAGTVIGLFFGLAGVIFGPFLGAFLGELVHSRQTGLATKVGLGTWVGLILGTVAKLGIAFLMLGIFALSWLL